MMDSGALNVGHGSEDVVNARWTGERKFTGVIGSRFVRSSFELNQNRAEVWAVMGHVRASHQSGGNATIVELMTPPLRWLPMGRKTQLRASSRSYCSGIEETRTSISTPTLRPTREGR